MNVTDTLSKIAIALGRLLLPLQEVLFDFDLFENFVAGFGWDVSDLTEIPNAFSSLSTLLNTLGEDLSDITMEDVSPAKLEKLIGTLQASFSKIDSIKNGVGIPAQLIDGGFQSIFPRQLLDFLIVDYLYLNHPVLAHTLAILGLIRIRYVKASGVRMDFMSFTFSYEDLPGILDDPKILFKNAYSWGNDDFDAAALIEQVDNLLVYLKAHVYIEYTEPEVIARLSEQPLTNQLPERAVKAALYDYMVDGENFKAGLGLFALPKQDDLKPGLAILPFISGTYDEPFLVNENLYVTLEGDLDSQGGLGIVLRPERNIQLVTGLNDSPSAATASGKLELKLLYKNTSGDPVLLLGSPEGSRLEYQSLSQTGGMDVDGVDRAKLYIEIGLVRGKVIIKPAGADSFLKSILPEEGITASFDVAIGISNTTGFYLRGSTTLDLNVPTHVSLGPIEVEAIIIAIHPEVNQIPFNIGASITTNLGAIIVTLINVGFKTAFAFPGRGGNLGVFNVDIGFKPPDGIGLLIDAGPVTGGGFLQFDPDKGRYAGALELEIYNISVKAIGILDTKIPGGKPAYSFLILISTEFTPIPVGFGFTLNGVGGLAGIQRRMVVEELRKRLLQNSLDSILFPKNPIRDAARIISDLQAVFPPAEDRYVFGPIAIIGWGNPTLLEGKLGILLEVPQPVRLVLLGQFRLALPSKEKAIVDIHLDLIGEIDQERQRIALDGRLRDSKVVSFTIEGEMAMRLVGGDEPNFTLSIGGFHPDYRPPADFPKLKRVTIPIGLDDNPRLTLTGYLALTSNTLQIGAAADLYAEAGGFNIHGKVSFDALFTFSPFSFVTDFSAKVALCEGDTVLACVKLEATLSGPTPWHAMGEACLEIRWLPDICVDFDMSFGNEEYVELPKVDPWPLLKEAVENPQSWSGVRPSGVFRGATLAPRRGTTNRILLDPAGGATLRQTVVPLNRRISKFGASQPPAGSDRFNISVTGGDRSVVKDFFAPAQFEELADDEKLSSPSFEQMDAGITLARNKVDVGEVISARVEYDTKIIDSAFETRGNDRYKPTLELQMATLGRSAAANAPLRKSGSTKFNPLQAISLLAALDQELFVVASTFDLGQHSEITPATSKGAAFQALADHLASHPDQRGRLEVFSLDELAQEA